MCGTGHRVSCVRGMGRLEETWRQGFVLCIILKRSCRLQDVGGGRSGISQKHAKGGAPRKRVHGGRSAARRLVCLSYVTLPSCLAARPNQRRYALFPESSRGERTLLHIYTTPIGTTQVVDLLCSVTNESRRGRPTSRLPDAVRGEREPHVSAITFNRTLQY